MLKYFLVFLCTGVVVAQKPSIDTDLNPELQYKVSKRQIDESLQVLQSQCEGTVQKAHEVYINCLHDLINPKVLYKEIGHAKRKDQVAEVFKKFCYKKSDLQGCFQNAKIETIKPCLSLEEQKNLKTISNITEQLAEFICFKDGDRLSHFFTQHGWNCLSEKDFEIQKCLKETLGYSFTSYQDLFSMNNLSQIYFGEKECDLSTNFQKCVVSSLQACKAPSAANFIESLLKVARETTPCNELKGNSANTLTIRSIAMVAIIFSLIVCLS